VGDIAALPEPAVVAILGPASGHHLYALAHNRDPRRVQVGRRRRSIGAQHAIGRGPHSRTDIDATLAALVDRVARRLRAAHRVTRTVVLRLRFVDFSRATRSRTLVTATANTTAALDALRGLLDDAWPLIRTRGITLVGVALTNLQDDAAVQLALPFDATSTDALDTALDDVRDRFGSRSVTRATQLGRREHLSVPILSD
jgi:DNA polymerase-4